MNIGIDIAPIKTTVITCGDLSLEEQLNVFLADEYITASQYFLGIIVAKGHALEFMTKLFEDSYADELVHMKKISDFMQSLNMNLEVSLNDLVANASFPFRHLNSEETTSTLCNLMNESENAAIDSYSRFIKDFNCDEYPELKNLIAEILLEEREHKKELDDLASALSGHGSNTLPIANFEDNKKSNDVQVVDVTPVVSNPIDKILPSSFHNIFKNVFLKGI